MNSTAQTPATDDADIEMLEKVKAAYANAKREIAQIIIGQDEIVEDLLIALFTNGHCIIVGVPGLAKTLLVNTIARLLSLSFSRIQFTPDLMPSDIIGTEIIQQDADGNRALRFVNGPIFANIVLADEINRTPPKTQAALLESMQEKQITAGGQTRPLPLPFFVIATQNPIEQEGTYSLPEAQLDRFMFMLNVGYPTFEEEVQIVNVDSEDKLDHQPILDGKELLELRTIVKRVPVPEHVTRYAVSLVHATRPKSALATDYVREFIAWGAGPRASKNLVLAARARAVLRGNYFVSNDDVRSVAHIVLRHRILVNFNGEAEGYDPDAIIDKLIDDVVPPESVGTS